MLYDTSPDFSQAEAGTSLVVQWLGLCVSTAGGTGSIPGRGTKIPHALRHGPKKKKKKKSVLHLEASWTNANTLRALSATLSTTQSVLLNYPVVQVLSSQFRDDKTETERLSKFSKIAQLVRGEAGEFEPRQ